MDSFFCMHHVDFNVLKISPLGVASFSELLKTSYECVYCLKQHILQWNALYSESFLAYFIVVMAGQI